MKRLTALAAMFAAVGIAAGCGGDDGETGGEGGEAQALAITITGPDQVELPDSAEPGLAEITLENASGDEVDAQLIHVEGERSTDEVIEGLAAARDGGPVPEWFTAGGGIGTTVPGEERTAVQVLEPGTYYVFNTAEAEGVESLDPAAVPTVEVSGDPSSDEVPKAMPRSPASTSASRRKSSLRGRAGFGSRTPARSPTT